MVGADGQASLVNRRALRLLDLPLRMINHPETIVWPAMPLMGRARRNESVATPALPALLEGAQIVQRDNKVLEVQSYPTSLGGFVLTYTDITERKMAEARILHAAHHDLLTDLPNRLLLNECIARAVEQEGRQGRHFAIFGLDLDGFKAINDAMGHDAGDLVLCRFAERLRRLVRPGDVAARTGGDEFTVLVRDIDGPEAAESMARRLLEDLTFSVDLGGFVSPLVCSIGVAVFPEDGTDGRALLKNADTALYQTKGGGKGNFRRFEHWMDQSLAERRALEGDLRQALARDELEVYFQPQFGCAALNLLGFEALVRWRHEKRGFVPPDVFIPLAEECGLIDAIGSAVLEKSCRLAAGWRLPLRVAVNLSPVQFRGDGLVAKVSDILRRTGFPANLLELEVTEGVLIKDEALALNTLRALKELGSSIVLDDFGTGYSSLSYLRRFPFGKIKIDKSFVWAQQQDAGTRTILEAVLSMSARLNLSVIAEGVETREQLAMLREQGCPEIQGFLTGRPMPAAAVEGFIQSACGEDSPERSHLWLASSNPPSKGKSAA
jgi:diguanylate cyclase (GGDEF)-like protein